MSSNPYQPPDFAPRPPRRRRFDPSRAGLLWFAPFLLGFAGAAPIVALPAASRGFQVACSVALVLGVAIAIIFGLLVRRSD